MPIEILPTIDARPSKRSYYISAIYFICLMMAVYFVSDTERISEIFICFLTWVDDLFVDQVEILM